MQICEAMHSLENTNVVLCTLATRNVFLENFDPEYEDFFKVKIWGEAISHMDEDCTV